MHSSESKPWCFIATELWGEDAAETCALRALRDAILHRYALGRAFTPDEDKPEAPHVVLLTWSLFQRRFAGDASILGKQIRLEGKKSERGREQRLKLLAGRGFVKLSRWLVQRYGTGIGRDDLIDACACAVAARDSKARLGGDEVDARGLRMEINY